MLGTFIARRYRLDASLGRGAHGEVWRAHDEVLDQTVAVKLVDRDRSLHERARIQREAASLRLLRMPGVVRLLDDGIDGERAFFVMEVVDGAPFPGRAIPCAWSEIAAATFSLLDVLDRVHASGVVHRDLKPANVLVSADGRATLLDFGISRMTTTRRDELTARGALLGTPSYLAPEQIRGGHVGPAADLYAVGVVLHHALSGRLPHESVHMPELFRTRLSEPPMPMRDRVPSLDRDVADAIDRMLEIDPLRRPPSARAVIQRMRGEAAPIDRTLPWLGSREPIDGARAAIASGRAVVVHGPPGSGRSRAIDEIRDGMDRPVVSVRRGIRPFSSVEDLVGSFDESDTLERIDARVRTALDELFARGAALVCDDWQHLDSRTRRALEPRLSSHRLLVGSTEPLAAGAHEWHLTALEASALERLFLGHERIFHLRSDAARLLHARTGGWPLAVVRELGAWARAGVAREVDGRFRVDRDGIESIDRGLAPVDADDDPRRTAELPAHLVDVAVWIALAGEQATPKLLARAAGDATWRIDAAIQELVERGVARADDGVASLRRSITPEAHWPAARVQSALRTIVSATPPGSPGRLMSLLQVSDGDDLEIAEEALAAAESTHAPRRALPLLQEGLRAIRHTEDGDARVAIRDRIFQAWFERIATELAPRAADRLLYELQRETAPSETLERVEQLTRALLEVSLDPPRALERLEALPPIDDLALERRRAGLRMIAARSTSAEKERAVLDDVAAWAERTNDAETLARLDGWRGRWEYRNGRYAEAAALHFRAASGLSSPLDRIAAQLNGASALLEALDLPGALAAARACLSVAAEARHPLSCAQAEWVERTARYRLGEALEPDVALVDAVSELEVPLIVAPVAITEAAIAWRAGRRELGRDLALRAEATWRSIRVLPEFQAVARALAVVCGEPMGEDDARALVSSVRAVPTLGAVAQVAGLLALARPDWASWLASAAASGREAVPAAARSTRLDVISADEAAIACGLALSA